MPSSPDTLGGSPLAWALMARRHAPVLLIVPLIAALAATGVSLLRGPEYVAQARLAPEQAGETPLSLGAIASQRGLSSGFGGSTESVHFYAQLLRSSGPPGRARA
jgi:hypothetical protein